MVAFLKKPRKNRSRLVYRRAPRVVEVGNPGNEQVLDPVITGASRSSGKGYPH